MSVILNYKVGVGHSPLYKEGFRCFDRSPCLAKGLTAKCVRNMRDLRVNADLGRCTIGSRRAEQVASGDRVSREALERVCLSTFRRIIGGTGPASMVTSCGEVGNRFKTEGGCLLASILEGR